MKPNDNYIIYTLESIRKDHNDSISKAILGLTSSSGKSNSSNSTCVDRVEKGVIIGVLRKFIQEQKSFNHFDITKECRKDKILTFGYEYVYYIIFSEFAAGKFGWTPEYKCTYKRVRMTDGDTQITLVYSPRRRISGKSPS